MEWYYHSQTDNTSCHFIRQLKVILWFYEQLRLLSISQTKIIIKTVVIDRDEITYILTS